MPKEEKVRGISITLPESILNTIDKQRGDVSRSRYILTLLKEIQKK